LNIQTDCIACIFNQALRVTKTLGLDDTSSKKILDLAASHVPKFTFSKNPPQNATPLYQDMAKELGVVDLYYDVKQSSIKKAKELAPKCEQILASSEDKFLTATKIAVVGNVIDLASEVIFDLEREVDNIIDSDFAIDDTNRLYEKLKNSKTLVYLADNAGENIFDLIYIRYLKSEFDLDIYYFVRKEPIINDLTMDDLVDDELHSLCKVVDSGVPTPGIVYELMNDEAKELYDSADCIISKGMGNYECLSESVKNPLFFLLKIKCNVVASSLNEQLGAIICKKV
jgi:uncharacterized protein with ATP-grasp and redox domains